MTVNVQQATIVMNENTRSRIAPPYDNPSDTWLVVYYAKQSTASQFFFKLRFLGSISDRADYLIKPVYPSIILSYLDLS